MQTTDKLPPPPEPSQVTITTVGPNGKSHTISTTGTEAVAINPALAPVAIVEQPAWKWWQSEKMVSLSMVGTFFVLLPISIAIAIRMIQRPRRAQPEISSGVDERLTRLEQSIDAIAIEMERVSEGQRYVTRLLASDKVVS